MDFGLCGEAWDQFPRDTEGRLYTQNTYMHVCMLSQFSHV